MDQNPQEAAVSPKQQVVERVRQAANVLVTVRSNPSVDELAATIGLTLMLNKLGKHATAVFSGAVPSTLEFLKPEETLEQNTDSLRDFIISLDKSKADKLRYKVEENVVRIFITPYRTSITEKDLEFSQGDFNVDVVLALGVTQREELDQAITSHGRILHDATVVAVTAGQRESTLGNINWQDTAASSLSEMLVSVSEAFQGGLIDAQMATAFLTGIVAETERFSNPKTTPKVMTMAAQLMAAGANQQLIANELQKDGPLQPEVAAAPVPATEADGALSIPHEEVNVPEQTTPEEPAPAPLSQPYNQPVSQPGPFLKPTEEESFNPLMPAESPPPDVATEQEPAAESNASPESILPPPPSPSDAQIHIDEQGNLMRHGEAPKHKVIQPLPDNEKPAEPTTSAPESSLNVQSEAQPVDPMSLPVPQQAPVAEPENPQPDTAVAPTAPLPEVNGDTTLLDIEKTVHSPHLDSAPQPGGGELDSARSAVLDAINQMPSDPNRPEPRADVGAQFGPQIQPTPSEATPFDALRLPTPPEPSETDSLADDSHTLPPPPVPPPFSPTA